MAACFPPSSPSPPAPPNPLLIPNQQTESTSAEPTPRSVSIDDVLRLLDGCLAWLQSKDATESVDRETLDELVLRVTLRIVRSLLLLLPMNSHGLLMSLVSIGLVIYARPSHISCPHFSFANSQSPRSNQVIRSQATFCFLFNFSISTNL